MANIRDITRMACDAQRSLQQLATVERMARHGAPIHPIALRTARDTHRARLDICAEHFVQLGAANDPAPTPAPVLA
ncbi:hypothetical protein [Pseudacidovorax intermedius]|uniref:hypothetical protein n=1 Tax=Pseudacidovorax intermedius TaxID=433924 RepID=UPI00034C83AE|nr:hypothetical protein [Pseudacidovorax intermedius]